MKKFLVLLCTMAMVVSMFSGIVLAGTAPTASISYWDTLTAGASNRLTVAVTSPDTAVSTVVLDFNSTKFSVKNAGDLPSKDWTSDVSGSKITYTWVGNGAGWMQYATAGLPGFNAEKLLRFAPVVMNPTTAGVYNYPTVYINGIQQGDMGTQGLGYTFSGLPTLLVNHKENVINGQVKVNGVLTGDLVHVVLTRKDAYNPLKPTATPIIADTYTNDGNFTLRFTPDDAKLDARYRLTATKVDSSSDKEYDKNSASSSLYLGYNWSTTALGTLSYDTLKSISGSVTDWDYAEDESDKLATDQYAVALVKKSGIVYDADPDNAIDNGYTMDTVVKVLPLSSTGSFGSTYRFLDVANYYLALIKTADGAKIADWNSVGLVGRTVRHPWGSWNIANLAEFRSAEDTLSNAAGQEFDYFQFTSSTYASVTKRDLKVSLDKTSLTTDTSTSLVATVKKASDGDYANDAIAWLVQNGAVIASAVVGAEVEGEAHFNNVVLPSTDDAKVKVWYEYTDKLTTDPIDMYADRDYNDKYFSAADAYGEATLTVGDVEKLNLNLSPAQIYAGQGKANPVHLTLANDGNAPATDGSNVISSYKFSFSGLNQKLIDVVTEDDFHKINGSTVEVSKNTETILNFDPETSGTITITVTAKYKDGSESTKSIDLKVKGFNVTVTGTNAYAGDTKNLSVTVMDGTTPINNASVLIVATPKVSGSNTEYLQWTDKDSITHKGQVIEVTADDFNINNGVYSLNLTYLRASDIDVYVYKDGFPVNHGVNDDLTIGAYGHTEYTVYGQPTYTATPNVTTVVAGVKDTLKFTLKDANGNDISNATVEVKGISDANTKDADIEFTNNGTSTSSGATTYTLSNVLAHKLGQFKVVAYEPSTASVMGTFTFTAVSPKLDGSVNVTDGFKTPLDIKVVDPRTNAPISGKLTVTFDGADVKKIWNNQDNLQVYPETGKDFIADDKANYKFDSSASEFKFYVLATDRKEDGTATAPVMILNFNKDYDSVEIARVPFGVATIASDPNTLTADVATTMNITLKDANGNGIDDKNIAVMGTDIGTTDTDGKITYVFKPVTYGTVNITATNDLDKTLTGKVTVGADATAPVVTIDAPDTVKTNVVTVTGTVKDDVKVQSVYVNNQQVMVIPTKETTFDVEVTLKPGANLIKVFAFDAAGNAGSVTKTVTYVLPTTVKLAIGSADATINGQAATGVAPYLKGNSTMVPFRFIGEAIGASVDFNAATNVVTLKLDSTTVVLTIGSTTALVNGEAKTMAVAPEIVNNRTMVPLRFVSEALGATVDFNAATSGITITR